MDRRPGSGRSWTATTADSEKIVEDLICPQVESPWSHMSPREIEKHMVISRLSVRRMVKRKRLKQFKSLKTQWMSEGTRERTTERADTLAERISTNLRNIERCVWQDEKDFTLEVPLNPQNSCVYVNGSKNGVDNKRVVHPTNKQSIKLMASACLTWYGATKPFFVNHKGLKVNSKTYKKHLQKELITDIERIEKRRD